jgi:hypothetical protein
MLQQSEMPMFPGFGKLSCVKLLKTILNPFCLGFCYHQKDTTIN